MGYLADFVPWIVFVVVQGHDPVLAAALGLVTAVVVVVVRRRAGTALDLQVLEVSTALYLGLVAVALACVPGAASAFAPWTAGVSLAWLALTAWVSVLVRRPFTMGEARRRAPREVWDTAVFGQVVTGIACAWAATFTVNAAVVLTLQAWGADGSVLFALHNVDYVVPAWFTAWYPRSVQAKAEAKAKAGAGAV